MADTLPRPPASTARWPVELDPETLRATYVDLAAMTDRQIQVHFDTYGRREGRIASPMAVRETLISSVPTSARLLEIGPFCQPVFEGANVQYLDVLDAEGLRERGTALGLDLSRTPQRVDYTHGLAEAAGQNFDYIFSSHNIEHQPDLVTHLHEVANALSSTGEYLLIVPDKRYCFDHFVPETTLSDVMAAFLEKRDRHTFADVIEHRAFTCHNDMIAHWQGEHGPAPDGLDGRVEAALEEIAAADGGYIDVHAWQFTPQSFRRVFTRLNDMGLVGLRPLRVYETVYGRNEFVAVLTRAEA